MFFEVRFKYKKTAEWTVQYIIVEQVWICSKFLTRPKCKTISMK